MSRKETSSSGNPQIFKNFLFQLVTRPFSSVETTPSAAPSNAAHSAVRGRELVSLFRGIIFGHLVLASKSPSKYRCCLSDESRFTYSSGNFLLAKSTLPRPRAYLSIPSQGNLFRRSPLRKNVSNQKSRRRPTRRASSRAKDAGRKMQRSKIQLSPGNQDCRASGMSRARCNTRITSTPLSLLRHKAQPRRD